MYLFVAFASVLALSTAVIVGALLLRNQWDQQTRPH